MVPSDTSAEVSESKLRDDVSSPVADSGDEDDDDLTEEEGSFGRGSEKEKVVGVKVILGSAMKLFRFLAGQLDGRVDVVVIAVTVD